MRNRIFVAQPKLMGNERKYVLDCIDSTWISSNGKYINAFEEEFASFCGVKYAIATNNGTAALHLALVVLGLKPGDEVIVPTVTYIATANAVHYCGATPVFVDVCPDTLNIDPQQIQSKITKKTRGIIPVHLYGHPAEMAAILKIAQQYNLWVIEDAAEAHGAEILGQKVGSFGQCAIFSFYGSKIVTTGEGGMITTNDDDLAVQLRLFRRQGMSSERRYWFPVIGYNYRMTNIQAAIGLAQMEHIESVLSARQCLAEWYDEALADLQDKLILPQQSTWAKQAFWMYTIFLKEGGEKERDAIMKYLDDKGIETRPVFYPLHVLPPYKNEVDYPIANVWTGRGINLPTHLDITKEDVIYIVDCLKQAMLDKQ